MQPSNRIDLMIGFGESLSVSQIVSFIAFAAIFFFVASNQLLPPRYTEKSYLSKQTIPETVVNLSRVKFKSFGSISFFLTLKRLFVHLD